MGGEEENVFSIEVLKKYISNGSTFYFTRSNKWNTVFTIKQIRKIWTKITFLILGRGKSNLLNRTIKEKYRFKILLKRFNVIQRDKRFNDYSNVQDLFQEYIEEWGTVNRMSTWAKIVQHNERIMNAWFASYLTYSLVVITSYVCYSGITGHNKWITP